MATFSDEECIIISRNPLEARIGHLRDALRGGLVESQKSTVKESSRQGLSHCALFLGNADIARLQ